MVEHIRNSHNRIVKRQPCDYGLEGAFRVIVSGAAYCDAYEKPTAEQPAYCPVGLNPCGRTAATHELV